MEVLNLWSWLTYGGTTYTNTNTKSMSYTHRNQKLNSCNYIQICFARIFLHSEESKMQLLFENIFYKPSYIIMLSAQNNHSFTVYTIIGFLWGQS